MMEANDGIGATGSNNTAAIGPEGHEELTEEELAYWIDWYGASFSKIPVIAKVVAFFSAMGSAFIVYKLVFDVRDAEDRKRKLNRSFDRLLLCLCVSDFMSSTAIFFGSWSIPANPSIEYQNSVYDYFSHWEIGFGVGVWDEIRFAFVWDDLFPQAVGTPGTCTAQGWFWLVGAFTGVCFTGSISLCFLFQVKYQWREQRMRIAEKCLFAFSTLFPISYSFYSLFVGGFGPSPSFGWCTAFHDGTVAFSVAFAGGVLMIVIVCLGMMFWTVRTQELRTARWSPASAAGRDQKKVFFKSMLYIGALLALYSPAFMIDFFAPKYTYYTSSLFLPMQGVLNVLIYTDIFRNECKRQASFISASAKSSVTRTMASLSSSSRSRRKSTSVKTSSSHLTNTMAATPERRDGANEGEGVMTMSMAFKVHDQDETIDDTTTGSVEEIKGQTAENTTEHDTGDDDTRKDSIEDIAGDETNCEDIESAGPRLDSRNRKYKSKKTARGPAAVFATGEPVSLDVARGAL